MNIDREGIFEYVFGFRLKFGPKRKLRYKFDIKNNWAYFIENINGTYEIISDFFFFSLFFLLSSILPSFLFAVSFTVSFNKRTVKVTGFFLGATLRTDFFLNAVLRTGFFFGAVLRPNVFLTPVLNVFLALTLTVYLSGIFLIRLRNTISN